MTKDEALKMAIERLKTYHSVFCKNDDSKYIDEIIKALEQPAKRNLYEEIKEGIEDLSKQRLAQEPFAYCYVERDTSADMLTFDDEPNKAVPNIIFPLYTHPHQWQGLTNDEIDAEALKDDGAAYFALGALWANEKLKEKNHG